jgi:hypothetical protein
LKQFQIKREKVPEDDDSIHFMNRAFLEDVNPDEISDEIYSNNASNSANLSDSENSYHSHSNFVYLETDYDPENSNSEFFFILNKTSPNFTRQVIFQNEDEYKVK